MANNRKEMLTSQDAVSESDAGDGLQPIATVDVDNYHGLSVRVILVYLVRGQCCTHVYCPS